MERTAEGTCPPALSAALPQMEEIKQFAPEVLVSGPEFKHQRHAVHPRFPSESLGDPNLQSQENGHLAADALLLWGTLAPHLVMVPRMKTQSRGLRGHSAWPEPLL